jgi:hypothetical protein
VGTGYVLRRTGLAKAFVQRELARVIASPFALAAAEVDLGAGTLTLTDLHIAHPLDVNRPLLQAKGVEVSMNTNPVGDVGAVHKIVLRGVHIEDLPVAGPDALRLYDVFKFTTDAPGTAARYPAVIVEDASVGLRFAATTPALRFEDVDLELLPIAEPGAGAASSELVLTGAMTTLHGTRVTVSGRGDARTRRFTVVARAAGLQLTPAAAQPFATAVADAFTAIDLSGHVAAAQLWLESDDGVDLRGGFSAEVDALALCPPQFPRRLQGSAKVQGTLRDAGAVNVQFTANDERGSLALVGTVQQLFTAAPHADFAVTLQGLRVDDELLRAIRAQAAGARIVDAFSVAPTGTVDGRAQVVLQPSNVRVAVDAELHALRASFVGFVGKQGTRTTAFPYPLHDVGGRVQVRHDAVILDDLRARDARGGSATVRGVVPITRGADSGHLTIGGTGIVFSNELREALRALDARAATHYDDCAPSGRADVEVTVTALASAETSFSVRIAPQGATATHATFPCRVDNITGTVSIDGHRVELDLCGERAGAPVTVRGRFHTRADRTDAAPLRSELRVGAQALDLDAELRAALQTLVPTTAELWPALTPRGRFAAEVTTWAPAQSAESAAAPPFTYEVRLDVHDGAIRAAAFPVDLEGLHGPIFVRGDSAGSRVDVHLLRGHVAQGTSPPANVFVSGVVTRAGNAAPAIDLTTIARGVALRNELRDMLHATNTLSRAAWDMMSPQGIVDLITRHQGSVAAAASPAQSAMRTHLRVQLRDVGLSARFLPAPVTLLNGEIEAADGRATAAELRGLLGAAPVIVRDGEISTRAAASRVRGTLTADDFPINDDLARLFGTSPLREAYLRRQARGRAKITALSIEATVPDAGDDFALLAAGQLALRDCAFTLAVPIEHVDGVFAIAECKVDGTSGTIKGSLTNVSAQLLGRTVHDFNAAVAADGDRIEFSELSARLHGGRLAGTDAGPHLRYETAGEGTVSAHVSWQGVRLSELTGAGRGGAGGLTGNLAGRLDLARLPGTRLLDATGRGEVHISTGRLGDVPLFRTIYAILRRQPQFTSADADFAIGDRRLDIERLTLGSQILTVQGKGTLTMDGYLDMTIELPDLFGDAASFLILPELLHSAVATVLEFKLHGYLRDLEVTPLTLFQRTPARRSLDPIAAQLPDLPRLRF